MKLREDVDYISGLVESKLIDMSTAKELASLPVFFIPQALLPGNEDFLNFWREEVESNRTPQINLFDWEDIPFWDFLIIINNNPHWRKVRSKPFRGEMPTLEESMTLSRFSFDKENNTVRRSYSDNGLSWLDNTLERNKDPSDYNIKDFTINLFNVKHASVEQKMLLNAEVFGGDSYAETIVACMMWHRFHSRNDRYTISVKSNVKPKDQNIRTREIARVLGPRIIYLDKLPSKDDTIVTESGKGTKAAHQRKGCWVTLRAERFRNHPMFQVKNGVYRKPAWIGDRTRIVHGATYTVIDKPINLE